MAHSRTPCPDILYLGHRAKEAGFEIMTYHQPNPSPRISEGRRLQASVSVTWSSVLPRMLEIGNLLYGWLAGKDT